MRWVRFLHDLPKNCCTSLKDNISGLALLTVGNDGKGKTLRLPARLGGSIQASLISWLSVTAGSSETSNARK